jgi:hypothetical protein
VLNIRYCQQDRIIEDGERKIERDAVLAYIRDSFPLVPLELKLSIMQAPLSRRELATRDGRPLGNFGQCATAALETAAIAATKNLAT